MAPWRAPSKHLSVIPSAGNFQRPDSSSYSRPVLFTEPAALLASPFRAREQRGGALRAAPGRNMKPSRAASMPGEG
eukprot:10732030-Alexandrium_andersonii.AAC.1